MKMQDDTSVVKYVIDLASNRMKDLGMSDDSLDWLSLDSLASALKDVCFESGIDIVREQRCYEVILLMTSETESHRTWFEKIKRLPTYFKLIDKMHKGKKKSIQSMLESGTLTPPRLMKLNNSHNEYPESSRLSSTSPRTLAEGHELSLLLNSGRHVKKKPYSPTIKHDSSERRHIQFKDASHIASYAIFDEPISRIEDELNTTKRMMDEISMRRSSPLRNASNYYKAYDPVSSSGTSSSNGATVTAASMASQTEAAPATPARNATSAGTDDFDVSMILSSPAPPPPPPLSFLKSSALLASPNFALPPEYHIGSAAADDTIFMTSSSHPAPPLSPMNTSIATKVLLESADASVSNLAELFRTSKALKKYRSDDSAVPAAAVTPSKGVASDDEHVGRSRVLNSRSEAGSDLGRRSRSEEPPFRARMTSVNSPADTASGAGLNHSRSLHIHDLNLSPVHAPSGTRKSSAKFAFDSEAGDSSSPSPKPRSGSGSSHRDRDPFAYTSSSSSSSTRRGKHRASRPGLMDDHTAEYDTHSAIPMRDTLYQVAGVVMNLDNVHLSHSQFIGMEGSQFSESVSSSMKLLLIFQRWLFAHSASTAVAQAASAVTSQKNRLQALIDGVESSGRIPGAGGDLSALSASAAAASSSSNNKLYVRSVAVMFYRHMMSLPDFVTELFGLEQWLREKMKLLIVLAAKCFIFRHWALHSGVTAAARLYYDKSRLRFGFERFLEYSMKQRMNRKNALHVLAAKRSHVNKLFMSPNLHHKKGKRVSLDFDDDITTTPDGSPSKKFDSPAEYFQFSSIERRLQEKQESQLRKSRDLEKAGRLNASGNGIGGSTGNSANTLYSTSMSVRNILNRAKESLVTLSRSGGANMSLYRVRYQEYLYTQDTINLMFKFRRFYHRTVYLPRLYRVREQMQSRLVSKVFTLWKGQHEQRCKKETALEPMIQMTHSRIFDLKVKHAFRRLYRNVFSCRAVREHLQVFAARIRSNPVYIEAAYRMRNLKFVQCFHVLKKNFQTKGLTTAEKLRCDKHRQYFRIRSGFRRWRRWCAALSSQRLHSNGNKHSKYILLSLYHRRHPRNSRSVYATTPRARHANHKAVVNPSLRDIPDLGSMHITSPLTTVAVEMMLMSRAIKRLRRWSKLTKIYYSLAEMRFGQSLSSLMRDVNNPQSKERERWIHLANRMCTRLLSAARQAQHPSDDSEVITLTPQRGELASERTEGSGGASAMNGIERTYKLICLHPETQRLVLCTASHDMVHRGGGSGRHSYSSSAAAAAAFDQNIRSPFSKSAASATGGGGGGGGGGLSKEQHTESLLSISKVGKVLMRYYDPSVGSSRPGSVNSLSDSAFVGVAALIPRDPNAPKPIAATVLMVKALRRWMDHCTKYHRLRTIRERVRAIAHRRITKSIWSVWRSVYSLQRVFVLHNRRKNFFRMLTYALKRSKARTDMVRSRRAYLGRFLRRWTEALPERAQYKRLHAGHVYNTILEILDDSDTSAAAAKRNATNKIRKALIFMTSSPDVNFHLRNFLVHHPKERFPSHTDEGSEIAKKYDQETDLAMREAAAGAAAPLKKSASASNGLFSRVKAMKQERHSSSGAGAAGVTPLTPRRLSVEAADRQQHSHKCSVGYLTHCLFDGIVLYKQKHYCFQRLKRRAFAARRLRDLIRGTERLKMEFALSELLYNRNIRKTVKKVRKLRTANLFKTWKSTLVFEKARHFVLRSCLHFMNRTYRLAVQSRVWYRVWGQKMRYAWNKWQQFTTHYRVITEKASLVTANLHVIRCFQFMKVAVKTGKCWRTRSKARALQYFAFLYNERMNDRTNQLLLSSYRQFHAYVDFKVVLKNKLKQRQNIQLADSFYLMRCLANGFSALCLQVMKKHNPQKESRKLLAMIDKRYLKKILSAVYTYRARLNTWYSNGLFKQPRVIFDVRPFERILEHMKLVDGHYLPIEVKAVERLRRIYPDSYNIQKLSDKDQRILNAMASSGNLKTLGRRRSDVSVLSGVSPLKGDCSMLSMRSPSFMFSTLPSDPRASFYSSRGGAASVASMTPRSAVAGGFGSSVYNINNNINSPGPVMDDYQRSFVSATPQPRRSFPNPAAAAAVAYNRNKSSAYNNNWDDVGSVPTLNTLPSPAGGASNRFQGNIPNSIDTFTPTRAATMQFSNHRVVATAKSTKSVKSRAASRRSVKSEGGLDEEYADDFEEEEDEEEVEEVVPYTDDMDLSPGAELRSSGNSRSVSRVPSRAATVTSNAASTSSVKSSRKSTKSMKSVKSTKSVKPSPARSVDSNRTGIDTISSEEDQVDEQPQDGQNQEQEAEEDGDEVEEDLSEGEDGEVENFSEDEEGEEGNVEGGSEGNSRSMYSRKSCRKSSSGGGGGNSGSYRTVDTHRTLGDTYEDDIQAVRGLTESESLRTTPTGKSSRSMNRMRSRHTTGLRLGDNAIGGGDGGVEEEDPDEYYDDVVDEYVEELEMSQTPVITGQRSRGRSMGNLLASSQKSTTSLYPDSPLSNYQSVRSMQSSIGIGGGGGEGRANSVYGRSNYRMMSESNDAPLRSSKSSKSMGNVLAASMNSNHNLDMMSKIRSSHDMSSRSLVNSNSRLSRANSVYASTVGASKQQTSESDGGTPLRRNQSSHEMSTRTLVGGGVSRANSVYGSGGGGGRSYYDMTEEMEEEYEGLTSARSSHDMSTRSLHGGGGGLSRANSVYGSRDSRSSRDLTAAAAAEGEVGSPGLTSARSSHDMSTRSLHSSGGMSRANSVYGNALKSGRSSRDLNVDTNTGLHSARSSHDMSTRSLYDSGPSRANSVYGGGGGSNPNSPALSSNRSSHDMSTRSLTNSRLSRVNSMSSSVNNMSTNSLATRSESVASLVSEDSFIRQVTLKINTDLNSYRGLYNSPSKHQMLDSARSRVSFQVKQAEDEYSAVDLYSEGDVIVNDDGSSSNETRSRVSFEVARKPSAVSMKSNSSDYDEDYDAVPYEESEDVVGVGVMGVGGAPSRQPSQRTLVAAASQHNMTMGSTQSLNHHDQQQQQQQQTSAHSMVSALSPGTPTPLTAQKSQRSVLKTQSMYGSVAAAPDVTLQTLQSEHSLHQQPLPGPSPSETPTLAQQRSQRSVLRAASQFAFEDPSLDDHEQQQQQQQSQYNLMAPASSPAHTPSLSQQKSQRSIMKSPSVYSMVRPKSTHGILKAPSMYSQGPSLSQQKSQRVMISVPSGGVYSAAAASQSQLTRQPSLHELMMGAPTLSQQKSQRSLISVPSGPYNTVPDLIAAQQQPSQHDLIAASGASQANLAMVSRQPTQRGLVSVPSGPYGAAAALTPQQQQSQHDLFAAASQAGLRGAATPVLASSMSDYSLATNVSQVSFSGVAPSLAPQRTQYNMSAHGSQAGMGVTAPLTPQRSQYSLAQQRSQYNMSSTHASQASLGGAADPMLNPQMSQYGMSAHGSQASMGVAAPLTPQRSQYSLAQQRSQYGLPTNNADDVPSVFEQQQPVLVSQRSRPALISVPSQHSVHNPSVFSFPTPPASLISVALNREPAFSHSVGVSTSIQTDEQGEHVVVEPPPSRSLQKQKSLAYLRKASMSSMNLKELAAFDAANYREQNLRRCLKKWAMRSRLKVIPRFFADRHYYRALGLRMLRNFVLLLRNRKEQRRLEMRGVFSRALSRMYAMVRQRMERRAIAQFSAKYHKIMQMTKAIKRWRTRTIRKQRKNSKLNSADYFYRMRQKALFFLFMRAKSLPPAQTLAIAAAAAAASSGGGSGVVVGVSPLKRSSGGRGESVRDSLTETGRGRKSIRF